MVLSRRWRLGLLGAAACGCATSGTSALDPLEPDLEAPNSVFLLQWSGDGNPGDPDVSVGCQPDHPNEASYDLALIEFADDGVLADPRQLAAAEHCIEKAKRSNPNGVIVVLFVHGWRHNSFWDFRTGDRDENLEEFQAILLRLALRQTERYWNNPSGRRVIGVYVGWPGLKNLELPWIGEIPRTDLGTFWNRYETAEHIARGQAFQAALLGITGAARRNDSGATVIAVGHSMGAMMLNVAYTTALRRAPMLGDPGVTYRRRCAELVGVRDPALLPDVVVMLNSAAESQMADSLKAALGGSVRKTVGCDAPFQAPLFVSVNSLTDRTTRWLFPAARLGRRTEGNADRLITHEVRLESAVAEGAGWRCSAPSEPHFGQSWHCLRHPVVDADQLREVRVDLPQAVDAQHVCHDGYVLARVADDPGPFWIVTVPGDVMSHHRDVFNARSTLLTMALVQLSGAVVGRSRDYADTFAADEPSCSAR